MTLKLMLTGFLACGAIKFSYAEQPQDGQLDKTFTYSSRLLTATTREDERAIVDFKGEISISNDFSEIRVTMNEMEADDPKKRMLQTPPFEIEFREVNGKLTIVKGPEDFESLEAGRQILDRCYPALKEFCAKIRVDALGHLDGREIILAKAEAQKITTVFEIEWLGNKRIHRVEKDNIQILDIIEFPKDIYPFLKDLFIRKEIKLDQNLIKTFFDESDDSSRISLMLTHLALNE